MQHLPHVQRAAEHVAVAVVMNLLVQRDGFFHRLRFNDDGGFFHQIAHVKRLVFHLHFAAFQLVHIQHVVDQFQQKTGSGHDFAQAFLLPGFIPAVVTGDFHHAADAVDRRVDVVAHAAQKIRLGCVRASGLLNSLAQAALLFLLALLFGGAVARGNQDGRQFSVFVITLRNETDAIPSSALQTICVADVALSPEALFHRVHVEERFHLVVVFGIEVLLQKSVCVFRSVFAAQIAAVVQIDDVFHFAGGHLHHVYGGISLAQRVDGLHPLATLFQTRVFGSETQYNETHPDEHKHPHRHAHNRRARSVYRLRREKDVDRVFVHLLLVAQPRSAPVRNAVQSSPIAGIFLVTQRQRFLEGKAAEHARIGRHNFVVLRHDNHAVHVELKAVKHVAQRHVAQ